MTSSTIALTIFFFVKLWTANPHDMVPHNQLGLIKCEEVEENLKKSSH